MLTIQQVGNEILGNTPQKFYVFLGTEYGVKCKYLDKLEEYYGNRRVECESVEDVLAMMNTRHLIPLLPSLYVVRYDDKFASDLSASSYSKIQSAKIIGSVVCIYENAKYTAKFDKFLPECSVVVDKVSTKFIESYLSSDYSNLNSRIIKLASQYSKDYNQAKCVCKQFSCLTDSEINNLSDADILSLVELVPSSKDDKVKIGLASRNYKYFSEVVDSYENDDDGILYTMLYALIDLEKLMCNTNYDSDLKPYIKRWSLPDIYNMYMNVYGSIKCIRSGNSNSQNEISYLLGLLVQNPIPDFDSLRGAV